MYLFSSLPSYPNIKKNVKKPEHYGKETKKQLIREKSLQHYKYDNNAKKLQYKGHKKCDRQAEHISK